MWPGPRGLIVRQIAVHSLEYSSRGMRNESLEPGMNGDVSDVFFVTFAPQAFASDALIDGQWGLLVTESTPGVLNLRSQPDRE